MSIIEIGKIGRIASGANAGTYIKIEPSQDMGGYYVFTSHDKDLRTCFDNWVQSDEALDGFIKTRGWIIDWE